MRDTMPTTDGSDVQVSFEFFPPKTDKGNDKLDAVARDLADLSPRFMSVTYGAGGSTRQRTREAVERLRTETGCELAHHLTCVGATQAEIDELARDLWATGNTHIVALRGDPPEGAERYEPHPDGYPFAPELVEGLKKIADFEISVAAYPEIHPEAASAQSDLDNLKRKFDAGASRAITQYFFETEDYFRWIDRVRDAGIDGEIVPGIMPVTNLQSLIRFSAACGATVPQWLIDLFDGLEDDEQTRSMIAASVAIEQCTRLYEQGVRNFHFYTLNRAELTRAICHALGVRAPDVREAAA